jgi:hypothetical protein
MCQDENLTPCGSALITEFALNPLQSHPFNAGPRDDEEPEQIAVSIPTLESPAGGE